MRLGQIGFSFWELIFSIFRKYPVPRPAFIIFSFLLSTYDILNERDMHAVIEQTRFLSTVFSCSEFKFGYLLRSKFLQEKCLRYFYLRELIFADRWKKRKN